MTTTGKTLGGYDKRKAGANQQNNLVAASKKNIKKIPFALFSRGAGMDLPLFFFIVVLLCIGLIMLFSASFAYCYYKYDDSYYFIKRQLVFAIVGVIAMLLISTVDYHRYHQLAWPIFLITILLLVAVLVVGKSVNGAKRWIEIGPIGFQPSEIAKFALILVFAHMISQRVGKMATFKEGVLPFLIVLGVICVLIIAEKHLSATIIVATIGVIMMFVGGTKIRYFAIPAVIGVVAIGVLLLFSEKFGYASSRVEVWLDPFNPKLGSDEAWQIQQSLYAIGSGQLLGVGLGQSRQKHLYLPEPQNDFIFAIVCEELGFVGALVVIILFALLIWRGIYVSLHARDKFGTMLGLGITFQIGIQIVLNICVVTNTIPNTGISLPFFSYGGTALMIILAEMGILLQISRSSNIEKM
ncbi:putative lipid II flippase FtsW [Scatolibacter rhodanostii]|uniref:putative lipid II flippase FtsW n=1 Tax=Scatolibacter rhodanostii TaxID=2014781 RepID=UPI001FA904B7|nr:putative lipid II flippase FtsW [Scatolibacter rhodanostii]